MKEAHRWKRAQSPSWHRLFSGIKYPERVTREVFKRQIAFPLAYAGVTESVPAIVSAAISPASPPGWQNCALVMSPDSPQLYPPFWPIAYSRSSDLPAQGFYKQALEGDRFLKPTYRYVAVSAPAPQPVATFRLTAPSVYELQVPDALGEYVVAIVYEIPGSPRLPACPAIRPEP